MRHICTVLIKRNRLRLIPFTQLIQCAAKNFAVIVGYVISATSCEKYFRKIFIEANRSLVVLRINNGAQWLRSFITAASIGLRIKQIRKFFSRPSIGLCAGSISSVTCKNNGAVFIQHSSVIKCSGVQRLHILHRKRRRIFLPVERLLRALQLLLRIIVKRILLHVFVKLLNRFLVLAVCLQHNRIIVSSNRIVVQTLRGLVPSLGINRLIRIPVTLCYQKSLARLNGGFRLRIKFIFQFIGGYRKFFFFIQCFAVFYFLN